MVEQFNFSKFFDVALNYIFFDVELNYILKFIQFYSSTAVYLYLIISIRNKCDLISIASSPQGVYVSIEGKGGCQVAKIKRGKTLSRY